MLFMGDIRAVLWVAVIPAAMAVVVLAVGVREPEHKTTSSRLPVTLEEIRQIGGRYWWVVGLSGVLALARFSEAFLVLKAQATGLPLSLVPLVMVVMSTTYALSAYPAGRLSDGRASRLVVILIGTLLLVAADIVLGKAEGPGWMMVGVGLWGLHMGFTQGLFAALVADDSPAHLRGTAFGVFYCIGGIATLLASVMAGVLWDQFGEAATFFAGALLAALAAVGLGVFCYISKEKSAI
jgi:MFS family permease